MTEVIADLKSGELDFLNQLRRKKTNPEVPKKPFSFRFPLPSHLLISHLYLYPNKYCIVPRLTKNSEFQTMFL